VINQRSSIRAHVNSIWNVLGSTRTIGSLFPTYQTAFDLIAEQLFGLLLVYIEESSCLALLKDKSCRELWFQLAERTLLHADEADRG
jgi:hypothetical protein